MKANIDDQLTQAFSLFDAGRLEAAYVLYQQLLAEEAQLSKDQQWQLYMGLVYVLSAAKDYDGALQYAAKLLDMAQDDEDRYVALHQTAMVYRMRGQYLLALELISSVATWSFTVTSNTQKPTPASENGFWIKRFLPW